MSEHDSGTPTEGGLLRSPLHDRHTALGAKTAEFGGWEMPLEYAGGGVLKEHAAVRQAVGVFDVSHLGKATVAGPGAAAFVNSCLTNDLGKIVPGKAQYTLCCDDETGGVVDDLIQYLRGDDEVFLIPNAANTAEVCRRLAAAAPAEVTVTDEHRDHAIIAVQGPRSHDVLGKVGLPMPEDFMAFTDAGLDGSPVVVCRTGYTGEHGYELVVPAGAAEAVWDAVMEAGAGHGILPCGLGARDTLRTEMGYSLHGQDISPTITPIMGRLVWAVGWDKPAFWGREVLTAERAAKAGPLLRGLRAAGRGIPRPHMSVLSSDGEEVGEVTSGTFSPTLRRGIGLALLDRRIRDGDQVRIDVRGRPETFDVVKPPFVQPGVRD
ncbi:MAG: glycine cleavage system aminomethyltransferase GcvT [Actinomycetota bacterium]|nr:glycine cleavage system aminomethyltransferase GcvT [Actinomycetota bacterium]